MLNKLLLFLFLLPFLAFSQPKKELRAVWITNVDSDVLFDDAKIASAMDYLAGIGINVIFPVVWNKGYTLYPSRIMDSIFQKPIIPQFAGRDPLKKIIIEAHRNGIEVIPWFEFGFACGYSENGGHIIATKPSWAAKNGSGQLVVKNGFDWMAGTNPEVQDFLISLTTEVMDNYEVDGVQGDDRLPAMPVEGGYDSVTVSIYRSENGGQDPTINYYNADWKRWRANKLNNFLRRWRDSVKVRSEHLILSSGPSVYPWGYDNYLQDTKTWVDSSLIDNFIPQLYRQDIISYRYELTQALQQINPAKRDIFFGGILAKAGSYVISQQLLKESIQENRFQGVKGECLFFYEALKANGGALGDTLRRIYKDKATLPYRGDNLWRPKGFVICEDSSTNTIRKGNWEQVNVVGYNPKVYWTKDTAFASFEWQFDVSVPAWYSVYAYFIPNFLFADSALYTIYSGTDSLKLLASQKNTANKSWVKLGDAFVSPGKKTILKLDNTLAETGKYIVADAAMLILNRKLSPNVFVTSTKDIWEDTPTELPEKFDLLQNFPNPFNPETIVRYMLPESGPVSLKVYDLTGSLVSVIVNEIQNPGYHQITFDASKMQISSGVYFYQLEVGDKRITRKMVLMK
jgi:uncharacterized lipoprotein YddW (UPF0748 family)